MLDRDDVSIHNGNFLGFSFTPEESKIVFFPVPWDVTTSYGDGTSFAPQGILEASYQLDCYDFDLPFAWEIGHGTIPIPSHIKTKNDRIRIIARSIIDALEKGDNINNKDIQSQLAIVNRSSSELNDWVYTETKSLLDRDKLIGLVGGDHSVPLGYMKALAEKHGEYGILQIDAHADLRCAYEGFTYSHASIMYNALELNKITRLVQVGIRDLCNAEISRIDRDPRIVLYDDWQLKNNIYQGVNWLTQCEKIVADLPPNVYISFDIDGLDPRFCPNTGTPVPGGLDFNQAIYIIQTLVKAGKKIIGFDLCEVSPGKLDQWDCNVGARLFYKLANLMYLSRSSV